MYWYVCISHVNLLCVQFSFLIMLPTNSFDFDTLTTGPYASVLINVCGEIPGTIACTKPYASG